MLIKEGNLLDLSLKGEFDIIINPSNCFHTPVSNLAKTIWKTYPFSKYIDLRTTKGNIKKLGGFSKCTVDLREIDFKLNKKLIVVNGYLYYSNEEPKFNYKNLKILFKLIKKKYPGKVIGFPLIGHGLKDISITKICEIIDEELEGEEYYMVIDVK